MVICLNVVIRLSRPQNCKHSGAELNDEWRSAANLLMCAFFKRLGSMPTNTGFSAEYFLQSDWLYDTTGNPTATIMAKAPDLEALGASLMLSAIHGEEDIVAIRLIGARFACFDGKHGKQSRLSGSFDDAMQVTFDAIARKDGEFIVVMASDHLIGILRASDKFSLNFDLADGRCIDAAFTPHKPMRWGDKKSASTAEPNDDEPVSSGDTPLKDIAVPKVRIVDVHCPSCGEAYSQQASQYFSHGSARTARDRWLADIGIFNINYGQRRCTSCEVVTDFIEMPKNDFHEITADSKSKIQFIREREAKN